MSFGGACWVEDERGVFWWPFCAVDGCPNRCCLRLNSSKCYPHTLPGVPITTDEDEREPETVDDGNE